MSNTPAKLALEDGTVFPGRSFGAGGERFGEVVFNTSMTGYQEVLTDPSYKGQIVTMTYPLIGNYGVNEEDRESRRPQVEGFIVRELARLPSNFRSHGSLDAYLVENNVLGLVQVGCRVTVVTGTATAEQVRAYKPDGIFLSNGPGDPAALGYAIDTIRDLAARPPAPIFGICLGHQLLGLAQGAQTFKLK